MKLEMSGFIQKDHFDLHSYLNYLFNQWNEHSAQVENKALKKRRERV